MFRRKRRPELTREQIEKAIEKVERLGLTPKTPRRGMRLGEAVRELDRVSKRKKR